MLFWSLLCDLMNHEDDGNDEKADVDDYGHGWGSICEYVDDHELLNNSQTSSTYQQSHPSPGLRHRHRRTRTRNRPYGSLLRPHPVSTINTFTSLHRSPVCVRRKQLCTDVMTLDNNVQV